MATPPSPSEEQLTALLAEVAQLRQRQAELEARVYWMERRNPAPPPPQPAPVAYAPPPLPQYAPPQYVPPQYTPPPQTAMPPPMPPPVLETQVGLNLVNRIAVVTLMLGTGFLFKYGVDNDWIGPGMRVILGILAGLVSLFAGDRMTSRGHRVFAQGLTGLGLGLLYLSFWAGASFYEIMSRPVGFLGMVATTVLSGFLATRYNSQATALLGMTGGYLTPIALSTGEDRPWFLFSYLFLLNLGGMLHARSRGWSVITPYALLATVGYYGGWAVDHFTAENRTVATVFALLFYGQFAASGLAFAWGMAQLLAPIALAVLWDREARFLPYEVLLAALGLAVAEFWKWQLAPSWTLACFWIPYLIWANASNADGLRSWVFLWHCVAFVMLFLWVPWWTLMKSRTARLGDLVLCAGNAIAYYAAAYQLLDPVRHEYMGLLALAVAGVHLALAKALWKPAEGEKEPVAGLVTAGVALTFATVAVPVQFAGFRITMAWAMEGALVAWIASRFRNRWFAGGAGVILALSVMRLLEVDYEMFTNVSEYSLLANARFLTFAVTALALWLSARFVYKCWVEAAIPAAVAYTVGHGVMLLGLALELAAWADRTFPDDSGPAFTVALSILMAAYAVVLVVVGVTTRSFLNRALGLALIGLVVVKLYAWDVWQLGRIFRILAFLGLGALMMAVSFLYSRYRGSIEKLLRSESEPAGSQPPPLH